LQLFWAAGGSHSESNLAQHGMISGFSMDY
jgi:hypothetical protein